MAALKQGLLANDGLQQGSPGGAVLGVLSEAFAGNTGGPMDQRVSVDPTVAGLLVKDGYTVKVEANAGIYSGFADSAYAAVGCTIQSRREVIQQSAVLFSINPPENDFPAMAGKILVSWVGRLTDAGKALIQKAAASRVVLIDVTAVPRITIAQKLDVLSSQAKVAGHRAVIEATHSFGRFHTAEMTAAGKFPPSKTFILGCGVAGLAAIGTSKALGSVVSAWDVRDVSDQCFSMGAKWVKVDFKEDGAGAGGYAKESSQAFQKAQQETFRRVCSESDIVITTAAIPGRKSPLLITADAVAAMKPGSVIVDLAAIGGGNCELTRANEVVTTANGVIILGYTDLPSRMANQASAMYAQNMNNLLKHVAKKDGAAGFLPNLFKELSDPEGDIVSRSIVCCKDGQALAMPPPPQPTPVKPKAAAPVKEVKAADPCKSGFFAALGLSLGLAAMLGLGEGVSNSLLTTFLLAGAAGYQAVWGVAHALHTPLMSVTNAISGCTAIGGILLLGRIQGSKSETDDDIVGLWLARIAILFSAVNIVGGFVVSQRMLNLFRKKGEKEYSAFILIAGAVLAYGALSKTQTIIMGVDTVSALLCVAAIGGLASQATANTGCKFGILGVFGGVMATLVNVCQATLMESLILLAIGGVFGIIVGARVSPIALPQTVAAFHSLVGLAAMSTSIGSYASTPVPGVSMENVASILGNFIGGVTLTGSIIAFGKLNGNLSSKPLNLPGKNWLNLTGLFSFIGLTSYFLQLPEDDGQTGLYIQYTVGLIAMVMGYHLVGSVGGGDMPVCITVLNSYSGWALVAEGFLLKSPILTIVGSLIGFSGAILTKIMCDAMNRDIMNVIFGGLNAAPKKAADGIVREHTETNPDGAAQMLADSKKVLIVPGYGMAVARCQNSVASIAKALRDNGTEVKFGIHPVAGRMPGQMNVLLAEAGVPYDWVEEMEEVNPEMDDVDTCLIVGANDTTNQGAQEGGADHPLAGMPVLEVWRSKKVIFLKRTMGAGYADVENPVFFNDNTDMLLGNATDTTEKIASKVRELISE
eukprot:TRINITY_DN772_c0_g1_i8.p1 TRINITY_DN772_c0_g1~~TRINITY_DN772_c0_g1_i8.p1  ORF type:complete len:1041 (+),score=305.15 TRINITY_DN772_c0_g1_i8:54-3176(+)